MWMAAYRCHAFALKKLYCKNRRRLLFPKMVTILPLVLIVVAFHFTAVTSAVIVRKIWKAFRPVQHLSLALHSSSTPKWCKCLCAPSRALSFTICKTKIERSKRCWIKRLHQHAAVPYKQLMGQTKHILWSEEMMYVMPIDNYHQQQCPHFIDAFTFFRRFIVIRLMDVDLAMRLKVKSPSFNGFVHIYWRYRNQRKITSLHKSECWWNSQ